MAKRQRVFETTFARYTAGKLIGEGGSGRVYAAVDDEGKAWAIKCLEADKVTADKRRRFKNELTFCARNRHPNVLSVVDHGVFGAGDDTTLFYVMPLYPSSLRTAIPVDAPSKGLALFGGVLDGVEAAHLRGVVHRDLKPENILLDHDGIPAVADFGIARFAEDDLVTAVETRAAARLANFVYAAPEQRTRGVTVDKRTDVYALGLILNELFTGQVPHGTDFVTIGSIHPELAYLDEIVIRMLRQSPEHRLGSVEELKRELIGRRNEMIALQRVSELSDMVVPVSSTDDDPLIADPPRIVDFEWDGGTLALVFNQSLNANWRWALNNMGSHSSVWGKGPEAFRIINNRATIGARDDEVQRIIDHFKGWLPRVNLVYASKIERERREAEEAERRRIRAEIEAEKRKAKVLRSVKI